jgi:hypothetical protein
MIKVRSQQDLWAGLLFAAIGGIMFAGAGRLAQGTAIRMGPGYVPRILCGLLIATGILLVFRGILLTGPNTGRWNLRAMIFVLGSILVFALGLERLGLVVTAALVVGFSSLAVKESRPLEVVIVAVCMAAASTLLFAYGLRLLIPVWPRF